MKHLHRLFIIFLLFPFCLYSQKEATKYSRVGDMIEDYTFTDVVNYKENKVSISDFRGHWLILDFWGRTCTGCINSFPKMNSLHQQYENQVQIIMVGYNTGKRVSSISEEGTKKLYSFLQRKLDLKFVNAFDSILFLKHGDGRVPLVIVVDPTGIIRAKTYSIDSISINAFLNGKIPSLASYQLHADDKEIYKQKEAISKLKMSDESVASSQGDSLFKFKSLLTKWDSSMYRRIDGVGFNSKKPIVKPDGLQAEIIGQDLYSLLRLAFTGRGEWWSEAHELYGSFSTNIFVEIKNRQLNFKGNRKTGENMYAYSLLVPPSMYSPEYMRKIFREDLQRYFVFVATVMTRKMTVWRLIISDNEKVEKLRTKGEKLPSISYKSKNMYQGFSCKDCAFESLVQNISNVTIRASMYNFNPDIYVPFIDETGINYRIDISLGEDVYMKDFNEVRKALNKNGLDIISGEKEMKVIVVTDEK